MHGLHLYFFFFVVVFGAGFLMSFHWHSFPSIMIICIQLRAVAGADVGMAHKFLFLSNCDGAPWELVPYANCVLCV